MKDFALTNTNTHHAGRVHMRFVAALAFSLAASALFAAPRDEPFVCYRPDVGKNIYPWDHAAKWFDTTGNGSSINRVPTTNDYVFLYSSKNDVGANGKPMVVTNGVHAETGPDIDPEPVSFTGMNLTFRYDWREMREGQSVYVYRHDGSANGAWTRIGKAELSSVENVITTDKFDASSETWNAGWFAVVAQNTGGATIIFR